MLLDMIIDAKFIGILLEVYPNLARMIVVINRRHIE